MVNLIIHTDNQWIYVHRERDKVPAESHLIRVRINTHTNNSNNVRNKFDRYKFRYIKPIHMDIISDSQINYTDCYKRWHSFYFVHQHFEMGKIIHFYEEIVNTVST